MNAVRTLLVSLLAWTVVAVPAAADDLLFEDGFENAWGCVWTNTIPGPAPGSCEIAGRCFGDAVQQPGNACAQCAIAASTTAWSPRNPGASCADPGGCLLGNCSGTSCVGSPVNDGGSCDDSDVCTAATTCLGGACQGGSTDACADGIDCTIDSCDPVFGCAHAPSDTVCATDGLDCTANTCSVPGGCLIDAGSCVIANTCYASGDPEPGNACHTCTPAGSQTAWTNAPIGSLCQAAVCTSDTMLQKAKTCDSVGGCTTTPVPATTDCTPYKCDSGACRTSCGSDFDCATSAYCGGGLCHSKKVNGAACSANGECTSASCVDGVCCNTPCNGTCQACSAAKKGGGSDGTCGAILLGTDPDSECFDSAQSSCGTSGVCNGAGACQLWDASTVCVPANCAGSVLSSADFCNGAGTCVDSGTTSCSPYACSGSSSCYTTCADDTQCDTSTATCSSTQCKLKSGQGCAFGIQCASGVCTGGFCA